MAATVTDPLYTGSSSAPMTIQKATVIPTGTAANKTCDATAAATLPVQALQGVVPGDDISLATGSVRFSDKNAGTGKTVTATGLSLVGTAAANYSLSTASFTATANISQAPLHVTATAAPKSYDGTTAAAATLSDDRLASDSLTVAYATALFGDSNAATTKPVTVSGISISGSDSANYHLTGTTAFTQADIAPCPVSIAIGSLSQNYTGSPIGVTVAANPAAAITLTYNGISTPPTAAGSYTVVATAPAPNYTGSATATLVIIPTTLITVNTSPAGRLVSIDGGVAQAAPFTLRLTTGSHNVATATAQAGGTGTQYVFRTWSDAGAASHSIGVGASPASYTAAFTTQYQLTMATSPAAIGTATPPSSGFYDAGSTVNISATAPAGYAFLSWSGPVLSVTAASTAVNMSAPVSVTSNFVAVPATVFETSPSGLAISVDGAAARIAPFSQQLAPGSPAVSVVPTQPGASGTQYAFTAWSDAGAASHTIAVTSTATVFTASFRTQYQVSTSASPANGGSATPGAGFYDAGAVINVGATPANGYAFNSWFGRVASVSQAATTLTVTAPTRLTANFSALAGITLHTAPAGLLVSVDGGAPQPSPFTVSLASGPHSIAVAGTQAGAAGTRYLFSAWSDAGAAAHTITAGSSPATYTAAFTTQYLVSVSALPASGGGVSLAPASPGGDGYYNAGSAVTAGANPAAGYSFTAFGGGLTGAASPQLLNVTAPSSITANFALPNPAILVSLVNKSTANCVTTVTLSLANTGGSDALQVILSSLAASVLTGTGQAVVTGPAAPLNAGTIAKNGAGNVTVQVSVSGAVSRFRLTTAGTMRNAAGNAVSFTIAP